MPAITVTDLNNAKLDTDTIAAIATSQSPTVTDRLGNVKSTTFGAIQTLKAFNVRGVWATATAYALKDVYTFSGYAYVVVAAHTSTTVAADLTSGYVTIHQGVTREDLAASTGAGLVGANAYQNQDSVNKELISPKKFGAVADGVTDDTAAIAAALLNSLFVDFGGPGNTYKVSAALPLRNNHKLIGKGATLTQVTANTEIFNFEGKSDVEATGLRLIGIPAYTDSDGSRAAGFYGGTSGARNHITKCYFYNFGYSSVRFQGQTDCSFTLNTVEGPGLATLTPITSGRNYGVLFDSGCQGALIYGNNISKTAQGARIEGTRDCRIIGNRFYDITGQHGVYAGSGLSNLVIAGNTVYTTGLIGIKVQAADAAGVDNINISITGNTIYSVVDQGILVTNSASGSVYKCRNVTVTGNTVRVTGGSGISIKNTVSATVSGNTIDQAGFTGINFSESSIVKIDSNVIVRSGLSAISDELLCSQMSITNNKIQDCATTNTAGNNYGLFIGGGGTDYNISNNEFADSFAKIRYGIYLASGTMSTFSVNDNIISAATDYGLRLASTLPMRSYQNNILVGTLAPTFNQPDVTVLASAAALTIPQGGTVFAVNGTTNITSIGFSGCVGRRITLIAQSSFSVVRGGNIQIPATVALTGGQSLTISCDGNNWY